MENNNEIVIATFYHFADLPDFEELQRPLLIFCKRHNLKGTILLAHEGINSTISGTRTDIDALINYLKKGDKRFEDLEWKESYHNSKPFERMKVRLKEEIVRMDYEGFDFDNRGKYIEGSAWDEFIARDDVVVIDTRNDYETKIGTFEGAIDPRTKTFRQFPEWARNWVQDSANKDKKVAMFCTGGVRCEKSTNLMKQLGCKEVYHLKGGILKYFEETKNQNQKWQGECFVFDDRVAVDSSLKPTGALICKSCNNPMTTDDLRDGPENEVMCVECYNS